MTSKSNVKANPFRKASVERTYHPTIGESLAQDTAYQRALNRLDNGDSLSEVVPTLRSSYRKLARMYMSKRSQP